MTTLFDCALGDVLLSSLDERICILDIQEEAPALQHHFLSLHGGERRLLSSRREKLTVQVRFSIHEENPARRSEALCAVRAWAAKGGILTVSHRPGQRLPVICAAQPASSANDWAETLTLSFESSVSPYWEDVESTSVSASDVMTLTLPGTADSAPVDVLVFNTTGKAVTTLKLHCGETEMFFEGITLPAGGMFTLIQSGGFAVALIGNQSVLGCRTAGSDDLLLAPCGRSCTVYASASQPLQASFSARGRYL